MEYYQTLLSKQRDYFHTGATLPLAFRIDQLKKLKSLITQHESAITDALHLDLRKSREEATITEIMVVLKEIDYLIAHLSRLAKRRVRTPLILWPGRSRIHYEPYGCTLIIGTWNYPFQLIMSPLVGAISAGNCVMVKPSEIAAHTQAFIFNLLTQHFPPEYITAIKADVAATAKLLHEPFDYIFFTGGAQVGKIILGAAAKHLTPVTLELGGKSPCIIDASIDLAYAARRIAWGKWLNAGQTCVAPDYLYVQRTCKNELVANLQKALKQFYGQDPAQNPAYPKIINQTHFQRISKLMQNGNIIYGGVTQADAGYIAPTLIDDVTWNDPIMQEEIFGPLLPILTFDNIDDVIRDLRPRPTSLALYLFSKNKTTQHKVFNQLSFGGGCINDCLLHLVNHHLPFGGVGASGMGGYHGRYSFETFSHRKSVFQRSWQIDLKLEYPPYNQRKLWWIRQLFRL